MSFTERSIQVQLGERLSFEYRWVNALPQVVGPGADHTDVETEILLMRSRGDGERMVLSWVESQTGDADPLPSLVVKGDRTLEVQADHFRRQEFCFHNGDFDLVTSQTDDLVKGKDDSWPVEEVAEEWVLYKTSRTMEEHEDVEHVVPMMGEPEGLEPVAAGILNGKHKNHYGNQGEQEGAESGHGEEQPIGELGQLM